MSIDMAQIHRVFFEECFEGLDLIERGLLRMRPGTVDAEAVNALLRAAHAIKGGSGTFGFMDVSDFIHLIETLLNDMRDQRRQVSMELVGVLLRSVDVLREMVGAARDGVDTDRGRVVAQGAELRLALDDGGGSHDAEPAAALMGPPAATQEEGASDGWIIQFRPFRQLMRTGNDPLRLVRELASLGDLEARCDTSRLPAFDTLRPEDCYLSWELHLQNGVDKARIQEIFDWVEFDCEFSAVPTHATRTLAMTPPPDDRRRDTDRRAGMDRRDPAPVAARGAGSIRVDTGKIDELVTLVAQLAITQSRLGTLEEMPDAHRVERLREGLAHLESQTRALQESVRQIRMVPISFSFERFPRLVHDLGQRLGKQVELRLVGEETEVDRTVIEKIGDPLVQLIRNSLDHGIETPQERLAAGKPAIGTVTLAASNCDGQVRIEIRDDGRGLPSDKILGKAIERGLVGVDDELSDQQICDLVFHPGLSTVDELSDISGRGVGMDIVRRNIHELGGTVQIDSADGAGSTIIIRLPPSLMTLDGHAVRLAFSA